MSKDTARSLTKSSIQFFSGTLLSRLSGGLRDLSMAVCFGTHPEIAAFMVAFRFSHLFRRLFGEGTLAGTFTPFFETRRAGSSKEGALFFRDLFFSSGVILALLIVLAEGILALIGATSAFHEAQRQILQLTRLMLPGVLFICLYGLTSALLQCERRYLLASVSPVIFNAMWVFFVILVHKMPIWSAVLGLAVGVSVAFLAQLSMTLPATVKFLKQTLTTRELFQPRFLPPGLKDVLKPLLYTVIGVAAVQCNTAADALFARYASAEGPAYLWYAIRLQQVPLALFGIALSSALLPPLSRAVEAGEWVRYRSLLQISCTRAFTLLFPCMVGLIVLGASGVNLLYGHGHFTEGSVYHTTLCLWSYGVGLLTTVFVIILAPAFYAQKEYRIPMTASVVTVLINLVLNTLMILWLNGGAHGVALATSFASVFNVYFLYRKLPLKEPLVDRGLLKRFGMIVLSTLFAASATIYLGKVFLHDPTWAMLSGSAIPNFPKELGAQLIQFGGGGLFYLLFFLGSAKLLNIDEVFSILKRS